MELADFVGREQVTVKDDIALLRQATRCTDKVMLDSIADRIVSSCHSQLILMVPPKTKRKLESTIAGMGKRVKDYKKRIIAAKQLKSNPADVTIISLEVLETLELSKK